MSDFHRRNLFLQCVKKGFRCTIWTLFHTYLLPLTYIIMYIKCKIRPYIGVNSVKTLQALSLTVFVENPVYVLRGWGVKYWRPRHSLAWEHGQYALASRLIEMEQEKPSYTVCLSKILKIASQWRSLRTSEQIPGGRETVFQHQFKI